ncbi:uncharacterized protein EI97DRAFT_458968 [Westerdykella ornata]|uniref:Integral membrane protein n=1 Tax=Westerdykella ornata TaxID=318751 RepID=A0A6A6JIP1_WESOR|nr:uncharacterized protein EI97DRAFT_458968 [Westerdykella ornata]KAF2275973.1 integral membrane protein [Westerdykella ornata]
MFFSRAVSIFLRFGEFVSAAVVLGLMAWFLHYHDEWDVGPLAREIYTTVIASLSVIFSLIWLIPTTSSMLHYPFDLLASAAWFAAFGILVDYLGDSGCGRAWEWNSFDIRVNSPWCGKWRAAEAFSFISAAFWFVSFLLGVYVYHRVSRDPVVTDGTTRRRWYRSRV